MSEAHDAGELPRWSGEAVPSAGDAAVQAPGLTATPAQPAVAGTTDPGSAPGGRHRRRGLATGLLIGLVAGLLLAGVAAGAFWLGTRQSNETAASDEDASGVGGGADAGSATTDAAAPTTAQGEQTPTTLEVDTAEDADGSSPEPGAADGQLLLPEGFVPSDPNYETRIEENAQYAVVRGGKVYLYGFASSQEALDQAVAVTEGVMGPDGYVVERLVDPDAPEVGSGAIFVDDKVLFAFNSTELQPASLPVLDLGVALMLQNPTARMLIIARSDAVGAEDVNLAISQERGEAVVDYWESQGVERSRMTVDARGEADASETDDDQTAALNRSVEFVVSDIDAGNDG